MENKTITRSSKSKTTSPSKAILGGGLLSDSIAQTDSGKIHAQGIFTVFWAWGFPCTRNLKKGKTSIVLGIRKSGETSQTSLAVIDAEVNEDDSSNTVVVQLTHNFESAGRYEVVCSIQDSSSSLSLPVDVCEKKWVTFTEDERNYVKSNKDIPGSLRANVHCKQCSYAYIFEESILNETPKGGVNSFPNDGKFECKDCGHVMNLKDIQGRLRASLKELVQSAMRRE